MELKRLSLHWNRLIIAPDLRRLVCLESLEMHGNSLEDWPRLGTHPGLTNVNLSKNRLRTIDAAVLQQRPSPAAPKLATLNLAHNELEALPEQISCFAELRVLNLSNNTIGPSNQSSRPTKTCLCV